LRSIDIERSTPKFLKNIWSACEAASAGETQLFQKTLVYPMCLAEYVSIFLLFDKLNIQLHYAGVGSSRLIPICISANANWYELLYWNRMKSY